MKPWPGPSASLESKLEQTKTRSAKWALESALDGEDEVVWMVLALVQKVVVTVSQQR